MCRFICFIHESKAALCPYYNTLLTLALCPNQWTLALASQAYPRLAAQGVLYSFRLSICTKHVDEVRWKGTACDIFYCKSSERFTRRSRLTVDVWCQWTHDGWLESLWRHVFVIYTSSTTSARRRDNCASQRCSEVQSSEVQWTSYSLKAKTLGDDTFVVRYNSQQVEVPLHYAVTSTLQHTSQFLYIIDFIKETGFHKQLWCFHIDVCCVLFILA